MRRRLGASTLALALTLAPTHAHATPCEAPSAGAPLLVARPPANLGTLPPASPGTDAAIVSGAALLVDRGDYYGALWAGGGLGGRAQIGKSTWISATAPGIEYRFVANAVIEATHTGMGAGSVGVHHARTVSESVAVAPFARALVPTETVYRHAIRWGGDAGVATTWQPVSRAELVGGITVPALVTQNGPWRQVLVQPAASADAFWHPLSWLSAGAGVAVRANARARDERLESVEARAGIRLLPWRGARGELALAAPRYGRDRTDVAVSLSLGWVWGGSTPAD